MRNSSGYTVIEVLVTISILIILTTLTGLAIIKYQQNASDQEKLSDVTVIAEALERYYDTNGEYPSCESVSGDASTVSSLLYDLSLDALRSPTEVKGVNNSIKCVAIDEIDSAAYVFAGGDSNSCQSNIACFEWRLSFRKDFDGEIVTLQSRKSLGMALRGNEVTVRAESGGVDQIDLLWDEVTGASYVVERARDDSFSVDSVKSVTLEPFSVQSGLLPGTTYYFRVKVQIIAGSGDWSNVASGTTDMPTTDLIMTASMSGSIARGTASGTNCPSGTYAEYQFHTRSTGTAVNGEWSGWSNWSASSFMDVSSTSQGFRYGFQAQARCTNASTGLSSEASLSSVASVVRPIVAPAPTLSLVVASNKDSGVWSWASTCPSGTSATYNTSYYRNDASGWRGWSGDTTATSYTLSTNYQGYTYQVRVRARCSTVHATSPYSANSNTPAHTRVVNAPSLTRIGYNNTVTSYSWTTDNLGAIQYTIQRSLASNFSTVLKTDNVSSSSSHASGLIPGMTYYYRVRAVNTVTGMVSAWSNTMSQETTWIKSNNMLGSNWSFEGCGTYPTGCSGWGNGDGAHPANRMAYINTSVARHGSAYMDNTRQGPYVNNPAQLGGSIAKSVAVNLYNKTITASVWVRLNTGSGPVTLALRSTNEADAGGGAELAGKTQTVSTGWTHIYLTTKFTNSSYNKYMKFEVYIPPGTAHMFIDGAQAFEGTWSS